MGKKTEMAVAFLNGLVGDHLARSRNGLATEMTLVDGEVPIALSRPSLVRALPGASPRVALLVHGLMCTESIWQFPEGGDYGAFLARDFGFTPLYLRYNSGLAIPDNGAALCRLLDELVVSYPVPIEELLLVGYSMGGLVARSACHVAGEGDSAWLPLVKRAIYVGTPHLGAPLERIGRVVARVLAAVDDPYTRLIADIADLRSDGVKDLGDADLRHHDRARRQPRFRLRDKHHPVPLLPQIEHYLIAGTLSEAAGQIGLADFFGDSMVPIHSGTAGTRAPDASDGIPPEHVHIVPRISHIGLAHSNDVYQQIRSWLEKRP